MINSMTGFGARSAKIDSLGKLSIELRSSNHKFLEIVFHLPAGFIALEDRLKKEIEAEVKRGRITCVVNITEAEAQEIYINKPLLKNYFCAFKNLKKEFKIRDDVSMNTLIHLPGVLALEEKSIAKDVLWPKLKPSFSQALDSLVEMRRGEGKATQGVLKTRSKALALDLDFIKKRFKNAIKDKMQDFPTDEERSCFLKNTDITEEMERLQFHIRNFSRKISGNGPCGKELDFIAQEMQREANTIAAKSFDVLISGRIVQVKSQIEKIREQVQNIE